MFIQLRVALIYEIKSKNFCAPSFKNLLTDPKKKKKNKYQHSNFEFKKRHQQNAVAIKKKRKKKKLT